MVRSVSSEVQTNFVTAMARFVRSSQKKRPSASGCWHAAPAFATEKRSNRYFEKNALYWAISPVSTLR